MHRPVDRTILNLVIVALIAIPSMCYGKTTLGLIRGSGEFRSIEQSVVLTAPEALDFQWTSDEPGVIGGRWQITTPGPLQDNILLLGEGYVSPAPTPSQISLFTIPATSFLPPDPPQSPVKFTITMSSRDSNGNALGSISLAVVVTYRSPSPNMGPIFVGRPGRFPTIELVHYDEQIGQETNTQIYFAKAQLTLRATNRGSVTTDAVSVSINDEHVLMRPRHSAGFPSLISGASAERTLELDAILPPPQSQTPQHQQITQWKKAYGEQLGVDLRGWVRLQDSGIDPMDSGRPVFIYSGIGDSTPCQEGQQPIPDYTPNDLMCRSDNKCFSPSEFARIVHNTLACRVVGYSLTLRGKDSLQISRSYGAARTSANISRVAYNTSTKITVASVSKLVTALAAIRVLEDWKARTPAFQDPDALNSPIGPFLPSDWTVDPIISSITFRQLLGHRSGIMDYGNGPQDYFTLKDFFTQTPINPNSTTTCKKPADPSPVDPINRSFGKCYSNYNFGILRILLPIVAGFTERSPDELARRYLEIVNASVFTPVGVGNAACSPPASHTAGSPHAYAYAFPGSLEGYDWGDITLGCGAAGWYLSTDDMAEVLQSLAADDGRILSVGEFDKMVVGGLGWDNFSLDGLRFLEKNGGYGGPNGQSISTTAAILSPSVGAALFMNSNIDREPGVSARGVLIRAYRLSLSPRP